MNSQTRATSAVCRASFGSRQAQRGSYISKPRPRSRTCCRSILRLRRLLRDHAFKLATCVAKLLTCSFKCSHCWRKTFTSPSKLAFSFFVVSNCRSKLSHAVCKPLNCRSCSLCKVSSAFNKCRSSSVIV